MKQSQKRSLQMATARPARRYVPHFCKSYDANQPPLQKNGSETPKLCEKCQELELSVDKFVIYDGMFKAPKKASGSAPPRADFSLKSGSGRFVLGKLDDVYERMTLGCPLCKLIFKSAESSYLVASNADVPFEHSFNVKQAICYINWEIDGRDSDPISGRRARTRRLHIHWGHHSLPDSYLVFVAPQRLFEFNSDSQGSWEKEAFFLGRELKANGNNQVLMKSWLDQCSRHHGSGCSGDKSDEFLEMATQSYFGVIDCLDMCLKSLPLRSGKSPWKKPTSPSPDIEVIRVRRDARYGSPSTKSSKNDNGRAHPDIRKHLLND